LLWFWFGCLPNETSESVLIFALFISDQQLTNGSVLLFNRKCQVCLLSSALSKEGTRVTSQQHLMIFGGVDRCNVKNIRNITQTAVINKNICHRYLCYIFNQATMAEDHHR